MQEPIQGLNQRSMSGILSHSALLRNCVSHQLMTPHHGSPQGRLNGAQQHRVCSPPITAPSDPASGRLIANKRMGVMDTLTTAQVRPEGREFNTNMSQVKIYGHREAIQRHRAKLSDAIHKAVVEALNYPPEKRFHRFIELEPENFVHPSDRSANYTVIEISMFEGRSAEAKRNLIQALFSSIQQDCGIASQDVEITIFETPKANWGIRGVPGDDLVLNYKVNV